VKAKMCVLIVGALMVWGLKRHYAVARADDLWWVLAPTAALVEAMTGAAFTATPGEGYFSHERMYLIQKSCAGVNFVVAALGMLVFTLLHRVGTWRSALLVLGVSLAAAYVAAVTVNSVRIAIAMWLAAHPKGLAAFSAADVHRIEGIVVYFAGLVMLYELARRLDRAARQGIWMAPALGDVCGGAAVPLAAYYVVTLGLPLANGAAQSGARLVDHALAVILVPIVMVAVACTFQGARRSRNSHLTRAGCFRLRQPSGGAKPLNEQVR